MTCPHCNAALPRLIPGMPWPARNRARTKLAGHASGACSAPIKADPYAEAWEALADHQRDELDRKLAAQLAALERGAA